MEHKEMKTKLLIILVAISIGVIVVSTVGTIEYQSTYNQNCNSDGGKIVGFLRCTYINEDFAEPKTASDCRKIFGKGTTEMYDCLEKIEPEITPWSASYYPNKRPLPNGTFDDNLENVIPWLMMKELEKQGIKNWKNDPSTRGHTDEGWLNPSKMCSSLFVDGETKLYISTSFYSEPELTVSEIIIDDSKPTNCQKWFWVPYGVDSKTGNLLYVYDEKSR